MFVFVFNSTLALPPLPMFALISNLTLTFPSGASATAAFSVLKLKPPLPAPVPALSDSSTIVAFSPPYVLPVEKASDQISGLNSPGSSGSDCVTYYAIDILS